MTYAEIATSLDGPVCIGVSEQGGTVYDLRKQADICSFKPNWDMGGRRVAVDNAGELGVTASYTRKSLSIFDLNDGRELRRFSGLGKIQRVSFDEYSRKLHVVNDVDKWFVLNTQSMDIEEMPIANVHGVYSDPTMDRTLICRKQDLWICQGSSVTKVKPMSFGVRDACFHEDMLYVSESAGPLRCLDTKSGRTIWTRNEEGHHYVRLACSIRHRRLVGIYWHYAKGGTRLDVLDLSTGDLIHKSDYSTLLHKLELALDGTTIVNCTLSQTKLL